MAFSARFAAAVPHLTPPLSARGAPAAAAFMLAPLLSARGAPSSHALTPSAFQARWRRSQRSGMPAPGCDSTRFSLARASLILQPTPSAMRPLTTRQQGAEDGAALRRVFESFSIWGKSAAQAAAGEGQEEELMVAAALCWSAPAAETCLCPFMAAAHLASILHTPRAAGEPSLDSAQLQKLCRDAELLNRQLTATKLDLLFAAAVGKVRERWQWPLLSLRLRSTCSCHLLCPAPPAPLQGGRRLSYSAFTQLLPRLAEARCCTEPEVVRRLAACQGPSRTATTTPEAVRLADKANFTGKRWWGAGGCEQPARRAHAL